MRAERVAAIVLATVAVVCAVAAGTAEGRVQMMAGVGPTAAAPAIILAVAALSWALVGAVLTWYRPLSTLGWLLLLTGTVTQASVADETFTRAGWATANDPVALALSFASGIMLYLAIGLLPLAYPTGRIHGRGSRGAAVMIVAGALVMQVQWLWAQLDPRMTWAFGPPSEHVNAAVVWLPAVLYLAGTALGWVLCVVRLTRAVYPERQQLAWLLLATVFLVAVMLLGDSLAALWLQAIAVLLLPAAVAIGVLRYRLLGIETALGRAVTYTLLTGAAAGIYLLVTAWAGIRLTGAVLPALVGAALLAVGLLPLRAGLQRVVERFLYGRRGDPMGAVVDLGRTVASADAARLLEVALDRVARAFRARGAVLCAPDGTERARCGVVEDPALTVDLVVAGEVVGRVGLVSRSPGEPYIRQDAALLGAVAGQIALLLRAVELAAELADQRDAVVAATERERDRLRRDLHDGLGPSLTGIGLGLRGLHDALEASEVDRARTLTEVLARETDRTVVDVRRVLDDLRPSELATGDLPGALRRRAATLRSDVPVRIEVGELPALSGAVEDAVYRVVSEAVTNAVRHSGAHRIAVGLGVLEGELVARVADDGCGVGDAATDGIGLVSMRRRATSVGGEVQIGSGPAGTTVTLRVPIGGAT